MDKKEALRVLDDHAARRIPPAVSLSYSDFYVAANEAHAALRREVEADEGRPWSTRPYWRGRIDGTPIFRLDLSAKATLEDLDYLRGCIAIEESRIRNEAEKPQRPSLEEQEECVRKHCECKGDYSAMCFGWIIGTGRVAAANTLKTLREEVVPLLKLLTKKLGPGWAQRRLDGIDMEAALEAEHLLRKFGVEP